MSNVLRIEKPCTVVCTFDSLDGLIWNVSTNDRAFHFREFPAPPTLAKISFPFAGIFYSNKGIKEIKMTPLETSDIFDKTPIPAPERDYAPESIYIEKVQGLSNTPARTWAKKGYIQRSPSLDSMPSQMDFFIMLHELGHQKYFTEWKTDLFALYHFLKLGYNASQALYALTKVLNSKPENIDRIKRIYNLIEE